jgi:clan AA aspartic protease (TIGR02281 family)
MVGPWKVRLLLSLSLLFGFATNCVPSRVVNPIEPGGSIVIGRVVIDNKYRGPYGALPLGVIDRGLTVEVESFEGNRNLKVVTEEHGYFIIPNILPGTYYIRRVTFEGTRGGSRKTKEMASLEAQRPTFIPITGKVGIVDTLLIGLSEQGIVEVREVREEESTKAYFRHRYGGSSWASLELMLIGSRITRPSQEKVGASSRSSDLSNKVAVPLRRKGQILTVQAKVNGKASGDFILDTGATYTMISTPMAKKLGIDLEQQLPTIPIQTAGGIINVPLVVLGSIDVGEVQVTDLTAAVHDIFPDPSITGVLGLNFLNHFRMDIDTNMGVLLLETKTVMSSGVPVAQERPLQKIEQPPIDAKFAARPGMRAEKPEWKVGHEWRYAWRQPGTSGTFTREIVREDAFEGVPSYVVMAGKNEYFHTRDTLGELAVRSGGKVTFRSDLPYQYFSWPLEIGKEWRSTFSRENPEEKSSQTLDYRMWVAGIEEIKVPAGTFETYRIQVFQFHTGNLLVEYWYSPAVKWFVKLRRYLIAGVREEELLSFKVD